ncbi:MAG: flagellar basal body P-ring formation chaperone FlgA [Candidatus Zixiibacteriota bacterium]
MFTTKSMVITAALGLLWGAVAASQPNKALADKAYDYFGLNTNYYEVSIVTSSLKSEDITAEQLTFRPLSHREPLGQLSVDATVWHNGRKVESGLIRLDIRRFAEVLVVRDRILRSRPIDPDQVELKRMDVTKLQEQPIKSISALAGHRARRNLSIGKILTTGALEVQPDIEVGREISIVYDDGLCRVTAIGVARQSGTVGSFIKVKNKASGKTILARVVDKNAVAIDP